MEMIFDFLNTDVFLIGIVVIIAILLLLYINTTVKLSKLRKSYKEFMKRLGNGNNIEEMLKNYIETVDKVEKQNQELQKYCIQIDKNMGKCIQKVGMVRYNAFQDTGSDLSFTLAMLDENNNGVVLNGIYSREMSNIYAKAVENGKSLNTLSEEEKEAIQKAMNRE